MGFDQPSHWLVLAIVVAVLFGYKKLPDAARSVGRSLRLFKTEIKGMGEDDKTRDGARDAATTTTAPPAVVVKQVETAPVEQPAVAPEPAPPATVPSTEKPTTSAD
jgi:sec-independent protein translocase protein TatA